MGILAAVETKRRVPTRGVLEQAVAIAEHYGFRNAREVFDLAKAAKPIISPLKLSAHGTNVPKEYPTLEDHSLMPTAIESGLLRKSPEEPLLVYSLRPQKTPRRISPHCTLSLELIGMAGSFSEALLIRTALAILEEAGERNLGLEINTLGDRETLTRYLRECTIYYRKYAQALHPPCREALREYPLAPLVCAHASCTELREDAPKSIAYLNETGRRHFKEILEYLEILNIPYRINETLVSPHQSYTKTIFEIRSMDEKEVSISSDPEASIMPLVHGGRYDDFAKKMGSRTDIPAVGATIRLQTPLRPASLRHASIKPRAYFIQIGPEARRRSLIVLEILRRANIPILQSVGLDKLGGQLTLAESLGLPYTIIMGHKEAVEGSVIVRRTDTRSQETVPIDELARYAKLIR
jgi:histidyl-tRNA synthetase